MKEIKNVLWGMVWIILGLILGGNALGIFDINLFFDGWWTLFLIIPGLIGLITEKDKTGNFIVLLIGVALLLGTQGIFSLELMWKLILPIILVIIGINIMFKGKINKKIAEEIKNINQDKNKDNEYCATFSSQDINFSKQEFKGSNLTAVFGGLKCDLRDSKIEEDIVINAEAIFGGIEIILPKDIKVVVKSTSIFGGVDSKKVKQSDLNDAKTIYINATCIFGGVDLK